MTARTHSFGYESSDVYKTAISAHRKVQRIQVPPGYADLRSQMLRASISMALNIAEGWERGRGNAARNHFRIARGSAAEVAACIDILGRPEEELLNELRRVAAMLSRLSGPSR